MEQWHDRKVIGPGDEDYYGCHRARQHYQLALKEANDPVLQAMACRMAEECDRNWRRFKYGPDAGEGPDTYRAHLTDPRSREAYRAIEECTGYADFVTRFR